METLCTYIYIYIQDKLTHPQLYTDILNMSSCKSVVVLFPFGTLHDQPHQSESSLTSNIYCFPGQSGMLFPSVLSKW